MAGHNGGSPRPPLPGQGLRRPNAPQLGGNRPTGRINNNPGLNLAQLGLAPKPDQTPFANFSKYVDPSGKLNFAGKAIIHADGVDFSNGSSFTIKMDDLKLLEELGKGQYGTVQKVYHRVTNVVMAMKEIRLELDETKLHQILMELDILHKSTSDYIVEFYGAFFIESCVYYCMEYMDVGSLDKVYGDGVPEDVLAKITTSMVKGLKFLKDELSIIHRDVKPTNVLVNSRGQVKLCDFGVSGQLDRSLAKTNIGCQSYMAPERIRAANTYTVSSDVWSLGLSLVEMAGGKYPYKYDNMFAQLKAIVDEEPPTLPDHFSNEARDFIAACLHKDADKRPSYAQLLEHPFIKKYEDVDVDMAKWANDAWAARLAAKK
ncbi:kinase-like domain-containing protein [Phascolomyces articulosus]|uniref:mitogen-activated protein kinase kinase n=1 Tax=Phascolomyces articulosus TaxID=60185 RepID=A0AAD5KF42_9FUNG|nr:kinase-like domain-containing protein [Phascolomyces articulosus]